MVTCICLTCLRSCSENNLQCCRIFDSLMSRHSLPHCHLHTLNPFIHIFTPTSPPLLQVTCCERWCPLAQLWDSESSKSWMLGRWGEEGVSTPEGMREGGSTVFTSVCSSLWCTIWHTLCGATPQSATIFFTLLYNYSYGTSHVFFVRYGCVYAYNVCCINV